MAAGPRPVLLLAAIALLAVTASCERGYLKRRRNGSSPAPLVYSFGWGAITIDRSDERSCQFVCRNGGCWANSARGFRITRHTAHRIYLRLLRPGRAGRTTVYGTYYPAGTGTPVAEFDTCRVVLANGTRIPTKMRVCFSTDAAAAVPSLAGASLPDAPPPSSHTSTRTPPAPRMSNGQRVLEAMACRSAFAQ
ncbi:hypothetical protein COO60DRAFT_1626224 [Scenedesmus sp. NREL 46B-D3]|nr:hypothetical protein COO60DRAFT_1626224 [Scenedesmus sp. NREL 46B-D3]